MLYNNNMKIKLIDFGLSNWVKDKVDRYLPNRAKYNDAGSDVRALNSFTISPYSVSKIPLGFGVQIPDGYLWFRSYLSQRST